MLYHLDKVIESEGDSTKEMQIDAERHCWTHKKINYNEIYYKKKHGVKKQGVYLKLI